MDKYCDMDISAFLGLPGAMGHGGTNPNTSNCIALMDEPMKYLWKIEW